MLINIKMIKFYYFFCNLGIKDTNILIIDLFTLGNVRVRIDINAKKQKGLLVIKNYNLLFRRRNCLSMQKT